MFRGIFVIGIIVTLTFAAKKRANGKVRFRGNCETDENSSCPCIYHPRSMKCPAGYMCEAPGFGKASDRAQKKCYLVETTCPLNCPADWILNENSCYFISDLLLNYSDATEYCDAFGAHIVAAETPEENEYIKDLLRNGSYFGWIWLGLTNNSGTYVWDYTGMAPTYTDWSDIISGNEVASYNSFVDYAWERDGSSFVQTPMCEISCP